MMEREGTPKKMGTTTEKNEWREAKKRKVIWLITISPSAIGEGGIVSWAWLGPT